MFTIVLVVFTMWPRSDSSNPNILSTLSKIPCPKNVPHPPIEIQKTTSTLNVKGKDGGDKGKGKGGKDDRDKGKGKGGKDDFKGGKDRGKGKDDGFRVRGGGGKGKKGGKKGGKDDDAGDIGDFKGLAAAFLGTGEPSGDDSAWEAPGGDDGAQ